MYRGLDRPYFPFSPFSPLSFLSFLFFLSFLSLSLISPCLLPWHTRFSRKEVVTGNARNMWSRDTDGSNTTTTFNPESEGGEDKEGEEGDEGGEEEEEEARRCARCATVGL